MTQPSISPAALRGAVDLSALGRPAPAPAPVPAPGGGSGAAAFASGGIRIDASDETFEQILDTTNAVPAVAVIWSSAHPETEGAVDEAIFAAQSFPGQLRVVAVDIQQARRIAQALQVQQIPVTLGLVGGRPVPLYAGVQPAESITPVFQQLIALAAQSGVTGTFATGDSAPDLPAAPPLPPHHQAAFDAIERGDMDAAATAYREALAVSPSDADAKAGLAQVELLRRTTGVDHIAARRAAAAVPTDVDAGMLVADLDILGGHVEDGFARLVDLVRATAEDERQRVRQRLLELFDVLGAADERVVKARRALMSALF